MAGLYLVVALITVATMDIVNCRVYTKLSLCGLRDRIDNGCYSPNKARTTIECASSCDRDAACTQFVISLQDSACYHESSCNFNPTCSHFDADLVLYGRGACQNGGTLNNGGCDCSTSNGMVGDLCEKIPVACHDLQSAGYPSGDYTVTLDQHGDGSYLLRARCIIDGNSVRLVLSLTGPGNIDN